MLTSMESHDVFREHGVHLFIGIVQEYEDKIEPREKGTVHSEEIQLQYMESHHYATTIQIKDWEKNVPSIYSYNSALFAQK